MKAYFSKIKAIISLALCPAIVFFCASCGNAESFTSDLSAPQAQYEMSISVLDVGKADAIIIKTQSACAVIDTGSKGDGKLILKKLDELGADRIDYLFITHFDKDHVGGAVKLLNNIEISHIIAPDYEGVCNDYERYIEALEENGKKQISLTENFDVLLDDVLFEVYPPLKSDYDEEDNDYSLAIIVKHGENSFLFAGDAESERLSEMPNQFNMQHKFLKVPHHGVACGGTESFIQSVSPQYAVITCSEDEPADNETLNILDKAGCMTYQTANGTVEIISDGKQLLLSQTKATENE